MRRVYLLIWKWLSLALLSAGAQTINDSRLIVETVVSGLTQPLMLVWLNPANPNDFLVIEKQTGDSLPKLGTVRRVTNGVVSAPLLTIPVSSMSWEHGLLGIELHPNFAQNGYVYLFYTEPFTTAGRENQNRATRIVRYRFNPSTNIFSGRQSIWTINLADNAYHFGGTMRFGPDGKLFFITGDHSRTDCITAHEYLETNWSTTRILGAGGIYRLNDDGSIPPDNPFASHPGASIRAMFAYGIRNGYGLEFDPLTGWLWDTENGVSNYDEINLVHPGFNSGWRKIMGPDSRNHTNPRMCNQVFSVNDLIMLPNAHYADPKFSWLRTIGVAGMGFIRSARFPADIRDSLVVGESNNNSIYRFPLNANRDGFDFSAFPALRDLVADTIDERNLLRWGTGWGVVSEIKVGPDGYLYVVSHLAGKILRIRPVNPPEIIHGKAVLQGRNGIPLGVPLTLQLYTNNTLAQTITTTLDAYGKFSEQVNTPNTYTVKAKAGSYLSITIPNVAIAPQGFAYRELVFTVNGDINGDDVIDDADLLGVLFAFGSSDSAADLNNDGVVDDADLLTVLFNFGSTGG
jgi:glucose/arabinose dehydrogenase